MPRREVSKTNFSASWTSFVGINTIPHLFAHMYLRNPIHTFITYIPNKQLRVNLVCNAYLNIFPSYHRKKLSCAGQLAKPILRNILLFTVLSWNDLNNVMFHFAYFSQLEEVIAIFKGL